MPVTLPEGWSYFADWRDLLLALGGLLAVALVIIWWSQQTRHWHRIAILTFLAAFALAFASLYLFWAPPYYAGCPAGVRGGAAFRCRWRASPLTARRRSG